MAGTPTDSAFHADSSIANDTVTATVTRTITTTNADGKATTVYSSTDVKSVTVDGDSLTEEDTPGTEASSAAEKHTPVTHVEHTKRVITDLPGGLNGDILGGSHFGDHENGDTTADLAVQQLLSDMLRAGLKPKGSNSTPLSTPGNNTDARAALLQKMTEKQEADKKKEEQEKKKKKEDKKRGN